MIEKCKTCGGKRFVTANFGDMFGTVCDACNGTGIDLSTCEGVPPGSGAVVLWSCSKFGPTSPHPHDGLCRWPTDCVRVGIRFPASEKDPGRYFRKPR